MATRKYLLLNGPNLDMLGKREPEIYGHDSLDDLERTVVLYAEQHDVNLSCFQSNSEAKIIGRIHSAPNKFDGIVYNPGAHTHYSYALRDAVAAIDIPVVEVHLSNIEEREAFRRVSVIAPMCVAQIKGLGIGGYCRAIDILLENDDLPRLGEGFERHFKPNTRIIIAGHEDAGLTKPIALPTVAPSDDVEATGKLANLEVLTAEIEVHTIGNADETGRIEVPDIDNGADNTESIDIIVDTEPSDEAAGDAPDSRSTLLQNIPVVYDPLKSQNQKSTISSLPKIEAIDYGALSHARRNKVRAACELMDIPALLVRDTSNIRWLTAFDGVFDTEQAHALLITKGYTSLHTDSRYSNALRSAASAIESDVEIDDSRISHARFAMDMLSVGAHGLFEGMLGVEDTITYAEFANTEEVVGAGRLKPTKDVVRSLRAIKDEAEIGRLRAAQAITDAAFAHIVGFMHPGLTEREVQLELDSFMMRHGADGLAFGSIVACGENGADPHALPGDKRLEAGHCVVMDFGARAFGYCSDMTRMVFLGQPEGEMASAWEVLVRANETVEAMLQPGVTGREAHEAAERVLEEGGFGGKMGHGLGHGVGLDCHELPVLNTRNFAPLAVGNVVTVEPGIYLPGQFGMRLEDCGVITANGYDVFSQVGHDLIVL